MEERDRTLEFVRNKRDEERQLRDMHKHRRCRCRTTPGGARTVGCRRLTKTFEFKAGIYNDVLRELEEFGQDPEEVTTGGPT